MIKEALGKIIKRLDLTESEMEAIFDEIMSGTATVSQISAFLVALRMKGETIDEITGAAKAMCSKAVHIDAGDDIVDTCGTGGSRINTFNISTTAAFVAAGCGIKIAKHGNRSASAACGSADLMEALGVRLEVGADLVQRSILEIGIGFLYAPSFHKAMKYAVELRREIGVRTIFNMLGPLCNPANARRQVLGVYDGSLTETIARVLKNLGSFRALVVHGMDGLDEITLTTRTRITELKSGRIRTYYLTPERMGLRRVSLDDLKGGDVKENADITISILKGQRGPRRDIVLANTAAALMASDDVKDFKTGIKIAAESIDSGRAMDKLLKLIELTNR